MGIWILKNITTHPLVPDLRISPPFDLAVMLNFG